MLARSLETKKEFMFKRFISLLESQSPLRLSIQRRLLSIGKFPIRQRKKSEEIARQDKVGHYDIDGASYDARHGVLIASAARKINP